MPLPLLSVNQVGARDLLVAPLVSIPRLCIIQANIQERIEQFKVMRSIYKNALTGRIWLGDEIGLEKNIFWALQDLILTFFCDSAYHR